MASPILHILAYRFHDHVPDERIEEHLSFIRSLDGKFDGLLDLRCGRDQGTGRRTFTHGFVMTFASADDLRTYNRSDLHRELVDTFREDVADKMVLDLPG